MVAATAPELNRGDVLAGRYQIEAVIGNGGSGRVLRAFDRVTRTPVALKILRPEFAADPVWTERFSRELRVGRQIQHPNVCRVFDIGDADGNRFLSMELATCGTVRAQMEPGAMPRSTEDRIADARALIAGVAALHAAGIVHRDIKPENILRMEDGRLIVSDFGLATDPGAGPATTVMIGTPRYMAPEIVMGDPANARSDVWALGVVLHEILSGQRPNRTLIKRRRRVYTPPEVGSPTERRLVALSARCSEEDPEDRPASAVEVAREFEAAVRGQRFTRAFVRKQIAWGAVAIAALATLGLIRNRWTSSAVASSSQAVASIETRVLKPTGSPTDWSRGSTQLATFAGRMHCVSLLTDSGKVRAIWGAPRRAVDIDVKTGTNSQSKLLPVTYQEGCPQLSPNGRSLLFERNDETGVHVFLAPTPDGHDARPLVRGSVPEWLPNGQEFVFDLDSRHVGIFSIPTGQMTIASDGITTTRQLADKGVDASGTRLVVRYFTDTLDNLVVVQQLPSLSVLGHFTVPMSARRVQFSSAGDRIEFSLDGPRGVAEMVAADWKTQSLEAIGALPALDIRGVLHAGTEEIVVSRDLKKDLWAFEQGRPRRLTTDGQSDGGSLSPQGNLVIQRRLPDGRFVIVFRGADGRESQVTNGPLHMTPTFFPDGNNWLYIDYSTRQIIRCTTLDKRCTPIHTEPLSPHSPAVDPTAEYVAYVTFMNSPRLRLLSLSSGTYRDFGPVSPECAPVWTRAGHLWATQPSQNGQVWAEIDTTKGERTGKTQVGVNNSAQACELPARIVREIPAPSRHVAVLIEETSELQRRHPR